MKIAAGFTVVELVITFTVMGILLTLAITNVNDSRIRARDSERVSDTDAIVRQLDSLYQVGYPASTSITRGTYPTTVQLTNTTVQAAIFGKLPRGVIVDPLQSAADTVGIIAATNNVQTTAGVLPQPSTTSPYIYQPIDGAGDLCNGTVGNDVCVRFNLYYKTEYNPTVKQLISRFR